MAAKPSFELRLRVLNAVHDAPGDTIRERIKCVADKCFTDALSQQPYRFTWRTISTWLYRHKKNGIATLENKTRCDKDATRKVQVSQLAEAIHEVLPSLANNKVGVIPKSVLYRVLLQRSLFTRSQLAPTTFYRMIRMHHLLDDKAVHKQRLSFAMQFANQLWQADTLYGPSIKQADGQWKKTFLIASRNWTWSSAPIVNEGVNLSPTVSSARNAWAPSPRPSANGYSAPIADGTPGAGAPCSSISTQLCASCTVAAPSSWHSYCC
ncbi:MAG: hypothetical protein WKG03_13140 [Telluria sp.]